MVDRSRARLLALSAWAGLATAACATTRHASTVDVVPVDGGGAGDRPVVAAAPVTLVNHREACVAGTHTTVAFRHGERVLAELGPGARQSVELPIGSQVIVVDDGEPQPKTIEVAASGATLSVGCPRSPLGDHFQGASLVPLTLIGPDASTCPAGSVVRARAGGLVVALERGERTTLYLPRGGHVVRMLYEPATHEATVALGDRGAELVVGCGIVPPPIDTEGFEYQPKRDAPADAKPVEPTPSEPTPVTPAPAPMPTVPQ